MKELSLENMEQIEGGSCYGAIALALGTAAALAFVSGGWGAIAAILLAYGNYDNIYEQCF